MSDFQFFRPPKSIDQVLEKLKAKPASYWEKQGESAILSLFRFTIQTVPAYQKLLQAHNIQHQGIKTLKDFSRLPLIDKNSYLRANDYLDLLPHRSVRSLTTFCATSGSTGEPFYFPREEQHDSQYEYVAEIFLKNQFGINKRNTLGIIGFGLGIWIGGIFTYKNFNKISAKGYPLSLAPVGPNIELYLKVVAKFGHMFEQLLLMGYPPFIKDIIDEGKYHKIKWQDYNLKILCAAEGFSEKFRDYIARKAHLENALVDTLNIYGTVELGTMAHETALTNLIRRISGRRPTIFRALFPGATQMPTLAQYHPYLVHFETVEGELIGTGYGSAIPLMRYRFSDKGGVIAFDEMVEKLKNVGIDIFAEAQQTGISHTILHLPFVYVYGRSDDAITLRGADIYPEHVKLSLQQENIEDIVTGKFTMEKTEDKSLNVGWAINVELQKSIQPGKRIESQIRETIIQTLRTINSEFDDQYKSKPEQATPHIILWPYHHPEYFTPGPKQKWVKK